jgi:hypothetical protein
MADEKVTYSKNSPLLKQTQLPLLELVPHQTYGLKTLYRRTKYATRAKINNRH